MKDRAIILIVFFSIWFVPALVMMYWVDSEIATIFWMTVGWFPAFASGTYLNGNL